MDEPRSVGRPTDYLPEYCEQVEAEMAKGYSLTAFCGIIGVSRPTLNNWMAAHPEFFEAVSRAKSKRLLQWERAAMKAVSQGAPGGASTLIVFGLKNMGGDEWADKSETTLKGDAESPVVQRVEYVVIDPANPGS